MKSFLALMAALVLSVAGCARAADAPVPQVDVTNIVGGVAIVLDGHLMGFVLIDKRGLHGEIKAEDCAAKPACLATVQRLVKSDDLDVVKLESQSAPPDDAPPPAAPGTPGAGTSGTAGPGADCPQDQDLVEHCRRVET
jgi:hypothetical protein